ncbi:MAG: hypothetical protein CM15mP60_3200 [Alphaproteobacteria bacterium]|nr:MAG: hypothetical protein CM15mP60_3200 [Alphaproteobacteria bacterium]
MRETPQPLAAHAAARGLETRHPASLKNDADAAALAALDADLFVVVAYGLLLPANVLAMPRYGCINGHASLLPRWRGAAPIQRAIEAGDAETGICAMLMEEGLDTGPVLASRSCESARRTLPERFTTGWQRSMPTFSATPSMPFPAFWTMPPRRMRPPPSMPARSPRQRPRSTGSGAPPESTGRSVPLPRFPGPGSTGRKAGSGSAMRGSAPVRRLRQRPAPIWVLMRTAECASPPEMARSFSICCSLPAGGRCRRVIS